MRSLALRAVVVALLASCARSAYGAVVELVPTGQFQAQGAQVCRSLEVPAAFLVSPSPFGRPVAGGPTPRAGSASAGRPGWGPS